jgi:tRNA dimethylallyltransferase
MVGIGFGGLAPGRHVLIAGPTASGKSELALRIAETEGGVIVNADASQVYDCWRILTARPDPSEEGRAPHRLYGHVAARAPYSAGHWLREVAGLLDAGDRLVIVGGTGLYFSALTEGLAEIPPTPREVRQDGDARPLDVLVSDLDPETRARIDLRNRARVQRAWEVLSATGRGLAAWQDETGDPILPLHRAQAIVLDAGRDWLGQRIEARFDRMIAAGVLEEVRNVLPDHDPALPAHRAIGAPELVAHLQGRITLDEAREAAVIATRQFAKRQRTWFRNRMKGWRRVDPAGIAL